MDHTPRLALPERLDSEHVIERLEQAGRALLALPNTGPSTRLVQSGLEWMRDASELCGPPKSKLRPSIPSAGEISRMDDALAWIPLIPRDKYVLRRIVGARCLIDPMNDRFLFTWRRLATAIGADHKAVQRWHAQGIDLIVAALRQASRTGGRSHPQAGAALAQAPAHHGRAHA